MAATVQPQTCLQLCNQLIRKCGISGAALTTTANQVGEMARVVGWVDEAWLEIQQLSDSWDWMARDVAFSTIAGQAFYTPASIGLTDFAAWQEDAFRIYPASVGLRAEVFLGWTSWDAYRDTCQFGNLRLTTGQPSHIAQRPEDHALALGLAPDALGYTVAGRYYAAPQSFTADGDVPALPARFHPLIVYKAMQHYGRYESAPEVLDAGVTQFRGMFKRLVKNQAQQITIGGPLL